jgi:hypothetical protein
VKSGRYSADDDEGHILLPQGRQKHFGLSHGPRRIAAPALRTSSAKR